MSEGGATARFFYSEAESLQIHVAKLPAAVFSTFDLSQSDRVAVAKRLTLSCEKGLVRRRLLQA